MNNKRGREAKAPFIILFFVLNIKKGYKISFSSKKKRRQNAQHFGYRVAQGYPISFSDT